jgi:hypothetical protein
MMRASSDRWIALLVTTVLMLGCNRQPTEPVERYAAEYVEIATAVGTFRAEEVDAYFGPQELDRRTDDKPAKPAELLTRARDLATRIANDPQVTASARGQRLQARVDSLATLLEVLTANLPLPFAEEARRLYGLDLPPAVDLSAQIKELDELLPGTGATAFKLASLQNQLVIPAGKREAVFHRALEECQRRTTQHWRLPERDQLTVEFTREVESAWYRYEGEGRGKLQVNPLAVAFVGAALEVACHEGYPGHHAQFLLFDNSALSQGLPIEERVVLLRAPDSVLREGAASYGVDLAWTPEERLAFERDVLFPLAGLAPAQAERVARIHRILTQLGDATIPILEEYRDKIISFNTATFRLEREALLGSPAALLKFVDRHGAYVAGYTVARQRIATFVDEQTQASGQSAWVVLHDVLAAPANVLRSPLAPAGAKAAPTPEEEVALDDTEDFHRDER